MKPGTWLKVSQIINVFLVALVAWLFAHRTNPQAPPTDTATPPALELGRILPRSTSQPRSAPVSKETAATDWSHWIDALRTAGVPNKVLARLVLADFDDRWQKRMDELQQKYQRGELDQDALTAFSQERESEQDRELQAALGEEGFKQWDQENLMQTLNLKNIRLSASETNALYELQKQLRQQLRELDQIRQKGEIDEADFNERQTQMQAAFDQRVKALLGDERYNSMQGLDDGAGELRRTLRKLNPTDTQFQTLLQAQREWTDRRAELDSQLQQNQSLGAAYEEKIHDIDSARDQEYQRVLGTNAFDALQMQQDGRYTTMKQYATAWEIDEGNIEYIYRTIRYYEKSVQDYRQQARLLEQQGQAVDWNAVNRNLDQFSQQTEKALHDYLGADRFNKIRRNQVFPFETR